MRKPQYIIALATLLLSFGSTAVLAHGLHMTTAQVVQRQQNYLHITIETPISTLFKNMDYPEKPASLLHLANGSEQQIRQFRQFLLQLFQHDLTLSVAMLPLQSRKIRLASEAQLRKQLQKEVAEQVLAQQDTDQHHALNDRANYLRVELNGFVNAGQTGQVLQAHFPKELGQMMVSYYKPQVQTLSPSAQGSHYSQSLTD